MFILYPGRYLDSPEKQWIYERNQIYTERSNLSTIISPNFSKHARKSDKAIDLPISLGIKGKTLNRKTLLMFMIRKWLRKELLITNPIDDDGSH